MIKKIMVCIGLFLTVSFVWAADNLEPVSREQQQAITELIGALKHIRKGWTPPGSAAAAQQQQEKSIFQDGQEFKIPEFKPEESIEHQLQEIRDAQQEVIDKLDKLNSGDSKNKLSDVSRQQSEMLAKLKKFIQDKKSSQLSDDSRRMLDDALKTGGDAVRAMDSNNGRIAELKSRQAQAYISDVMRRLQRESNKRQENVLNSIQKDLNELDKKQQAGGSSASKELRKLAEKLKRNAINQHQKGTGENARELAELARDFAQKDSDSKMTDKEKLEQLKKTVAGLRENKKGTVKQLEEAMKKVEEYRKQLEYVKKHPGTMTDAEKKEMIKDMELAVQDAVNAMDKMTKEKGIPSKDGQKMMPGNSGKPDDRGESGETKEENNGKGNKGENGKGSNKPSDKPGREKDRETGEKQGDQSGGKQGKNGKDQKKTGNAGGNRRDSRDHRQSGAGGTPKTPEELRKAMRRVLPNYNPNLFNEGTNSERLDRFFHDLLISGKAVLSNVESKDRIYQFKNDEVPEKYREEVARYFEALSDTSKKRKASGRKKK